MPRAPLVNEWLREGVLSWPLPRMLRPFFFSLRAPCWWRRILSSCSSTLILGRPLSTAHSCCSTALCGRSCLQRVDNNRHAGIKTMEHRDQSGKARTQIPTGKQHRTTVGVFNCSPFPLVTKPTNIWLLSAMGMDTIGIRSRFKHEAHRGENGKANLFLVMRNKLIAFLASLSTFKKNPHRPTNFGVK